VGHKLFLQRWSYIFTTILSYFTCINEREIIFSNKWRSSGLVILVHGCAWPLHAWVQFNFVQTPLSISVQNNMLVQHYPISLLGTLLICLNNWFCNVGWLWKTSGWLLPNVHPTPFNLSCLTKSIGYWNCAIGRLKLRFWNSEHLITDVINDACAKGRTQTVWNTGTDQVQQSDFI
jgi:hypothetical protein